jgi:hypothetical protein
LSSAGMLLQTQSARRSMTRHDGPTPTDYVQSLAPGLMLIRVFDAEHPSQTFAKVTSPHARNGTAVSADTCRTRLRPDRWFGLSLKPCVLELGHSYLSGSRAARSASAAAKRSQSCRCGAASRAGEGQVSPGGVRPATRASKGAGAANVHGSTTSALAKSRD